MAVVALARSGSHVFWETPTGPAPAPSSPPAPPGRLQLAAVLLLLGYGIALTVAAAPVERYTRAAAEQLLAPADYIEQVRATRPGLRAPSP
jgi:multicomponent K+:H+ antiporter subunit D